MSEAITCNTIIKIISGDEAKDELVYQEASAILKNGGLVAFPTETVYGLGADALDKEASAKIYSAKGRPSDNPLIVHIAREDDIYNLAEDISENALKLAKAFWPGPMTLIMKKKDIVPDSITGGLGTVAIRMPSHPVAKRLILTSGVYIAAPSANTSGKPSPTKAEHVINDLNGRIDMIISQDTVEIGLESTIVDVSEDIPTILRPGYITKEMLEDVVGKVEIDPAIMGSLSDGVVPKAPGMKYKHYAPNASIAIVSGEENRVVDYINEQVKTLEEQGIKVAVMAAKENSSRYICKNVINLGSKTDELSVAKNLYATLRDFDKQGVERVFSESFSTDNVGQAVMNRLMKAAGHTVIQV